MSKIISKKQQKMYDALEGVDAVINSWVYRLLAPKRLVRAFEKAKEREDKGKKLTAIERTRIYGYLNPRYRAACYSRKRAN